MRRPNVLAVVVASLVLLAGCRSSTKSTSGSSSSSSSSSAQSPTAGQLGPEGVLLEAGSPLAPASASAQGSPIHGIQCGGTEQFVKHVHAHLAVYVNGKPAQVPPGIGLLTPAAVPGQASFYTATRCFYWLHTHAGDGIIHIESPSATRVFTLGDFFAEWRQPLSTKQVGQARGAVTVFVNAKRWSSDPNAIPLQAHSVIQVDVGSPVVPPQNVEFGGRGL
jgi:hypothetical protein